MSRHDTATGTGSTRYELFVKRDWRIPEGSPWRGAWKRAAVVGAGGLAASLVGLVVDPRRFGFSYLFALFTVLSVPVGALFFVLVQRLVKAQWSVTVRRSSEFLMSGMPICALLFLPLLADLGHVYPWAGAEVGVEAPMQAGAFANAADEGSLEPAALARANERAVDRLGKARAAVEARVLAGKRRWLNRPFFVARTAFYLLAWIWIARRLFRLSTAQDASSGPAETAAAQRFAPGAMVLFAITTVFASFDWLMSLDPMWYSTIFGVYVFSICVVAHAAALVLFTLALRRSGILVGAISIEHYHDLAKLLFGWLAFWAYIAYVQFFLSWYANVPDELTFFHRRWGDNEGTWKAVSASLAIVRFLLPFWVLMSRNVKRSIPPLAAAAALLLAMHVVEVYWLVLPNHGPRSLHWLDLTCLVGVAGAYAAAVLRVMERHPVVPVGDPRLARSLEFENA